MRARVVGTGSIGRRYIRLLSARFGAEVSAVPISRIDVTCEQLGCSAIESIDAGAWDPVDLTIIASRTARHLEDLDRFQPYSSVVLVEKPISVAFSAAQVATRESYTGRVFVSAPLRFTEGFAQVRESLVECGEVQGASVTCQSWLPDWRPDTDVRQSYSASAVDGGALRDLIHETDYSLELFGAPLEVNARLRCHRVLEIDAETSAAVIWRYKEFDLTMRLDYVSRTRDRRLRVWGSRAALEWDIDAGAVSLTRAARSPSVHRFPADSNLDEAFVRQIAALMSPSERPTAADLASAWTAIALCDAARSSSMKGGSAVSLMDGIPSP